MLAREGVGGKREEKGIVKGMSLNTASYFSRVGMASWHMKTDKLMVDFKLKVGN